MRQLAAPYRLALFLIEMRPTFLEMAAAAALFIVLAGMVVIIVVATIPSDGVPTLR